ncbi:hypothetical protein HY971_04385 [Candidatus Kaiserbacteria bacterium]|nr:hypothetical protein [Candidatus Kaiserbacteria bacterium]
MVSHIAKPAVRRVVHCIDEPDSVVGSHVSGMNVAIHLKRLFPLFPKLQERAGHGLAQK